MTNTVFITNPAPGGSRYTSVKKAHEFVSRGRAVIEDGTLRFINRLQAPARVELDDATWWNGSPKPKILQMPRVNKSEDGIWRQTARMRRPGEVRS